MIAPLRRFLTIFTLVSRIPVRLAFDPDFSHADFWLPLIGPLASAAALAGFLAGRFIFGDALLAILFATAFQYAAFNLFHLDGLLDTADAMLPVADAERRLEILKDSRIGVYAFGAGALFLALRVAALLALARVGDIAVVAALLASPAAGRAAAALVPLLVPPAREAGLGSLMRGFSPLRLSAGLALALAPLSLLAFCGSTRIVLMPLIAAASAMAAALVAGAALARLYRTKVGGFAGDALGCAIELGELLVLLALAAILPLIGGAR
ncbi:MAG TPA: adenosylcobinamide-GDP ribazoletransferase [Rectinemataceae bacterium]|nr:adenosylcobinamide-GDP ribazoletransferase [Rectinemataceae bacterium]